MNLSFKQTLKNELPQYEFGLSRIKTIDALLTKHPEWKDEAFNLLKQFLQVMDKHEASDIDFGAPRSNGLIWYRVFGKKQPEKSLPVFDDDEINCVAMSILSSDQKAALYDQKNVDFGLAVKFEGADKESRFRGNIYFESNALALNFRAIRKQMMSVHDLNLPEPILKRLDLQYEKTGLFLVTGITGSGKSTTLDSIIDMNNRNNNSQIIVIGNPIEFRHDSQNSIVNHREIGQDVPSFRAGTIQALRQDPDIIVVGEMRDAETIATVLEVTDSGHKVFSTLHTSSTVETIHRIIGEFPPEEQDRIRYRLADTLKVVVSQKLVPNRQGRLTMAKEILSVDFSVQAAIRNDNIAEIFQMITQGRSRGMFTLQQDLYRLVKTGMITPETALNYCNNRKIMQQLLQLGR